MASTGYNWLIIGREEGKEKDRLLGSCSLMDVDLLNGTAEYGIFIGSRESRGKGIGTEATRLVLS